MKHALREAIAALRRAPILVTLSATMVAMALFVVGLFGVAAHNLQEALATIEERVEIVAYLRDDARMSEVAMGQEALGDIAEVEEVQLITKEQALRSAEEDLPEFRDVFSGLDTNPLPASLEIRLREGFRNEEVLEEVAHEARLYPFVEDVRFGQEWGQPALPAPKHRRLHHRVPRRRLRPGRRVDHRHGHSDRRVRAERRDLDHASGGGSGRLHPTPISARKADSPGWREP